MHIKHILRETLKSFPGARIIYLGLTHWQSLKEALNDPHLHTAVLNPEGVRVMHDPGLAAGELEVVRVPDVWNPKDEKKPSRKRSKRKG
jgi:hypothetical protein